MRPLFAITASIAALAPTSAADVTIVEGIATYGVAFGCGPQPDVPPLGDPVDFFEEFDLTAQPGGQSATWHGWGTVSWNVSGGPSASIHAHGSSKAQFNGALCSGGAGWLYGQGHGNFSVTLNLSCAYDYVSSGFGDISGIPLGSGTLLPGVYTLTGKTIGGLGGFDLTVSLSPSSTTPPTPAAIFATDACPPGDPSTPWPAYDYDANGDGTAGSWDLTPPYLLDGCGVQFETTDEVGRSLKILCVAPLDDPTSSYPYYSARVQLPGSSAPAPQIGVCPYDYGTNSWEIEFEDTDDDGQPDSFLKSKYISREQLKDASGDLVPTDVFTPCVTDLSTGLVVPCNLGSVAPQGTVSGTSELLVLDAAVVPLGTDLGSITLGGAPFGKPTGPPPADALQTVELVPLGSTHELDASVEKAVLGTTISATGVLRNVSSGPRIYELAYGAANATVIGGPSSLTLDAGEEATYELSGLVTGHGPAALIAAALDQDGQLFIDAATFVAGAYPWTDLAGGLGGEHGFPNLVGTGSLCPDTPLTIEISGAAPNAPGALIIGASQWNLPLFGGVLVPSIELFSPVVTDSSGTASWSTTWPAGHAGGLALYYQAWIVDSAAPESVAATNALMSLTP